MMHKVIYMYLSLSQHKYSNWIKQQWSNVLEHFQLRNTRQEGNPTGENEYEMLCVTFQRGFIQCCWAKLNCFLVLNGRILKIASMTMERVMTVYWMTSFNEIAPISIMLICVTDYRTDRSLLVYQYNNHFIGWNHHFISCK